jgi:G3E family GTPase
MDLVNQIADLASTKAFDYIVIEASGICEPAPIANTISTMPNFGVQYTKGAVPYVDCIVTVVDSLRMKDEFAGGDALGREDIGEEDLERLIIEQLEFCNIVLLNKAAEVKPEELGRIRQIVRTLQPKAEIIECNYGDVDFDRILNTNLFDFDDVATSATWIQEVESGADTHHHDHDEHHHDHHHDHEDEGEAEEYGIGTYVYFRRRAFDLRAFDNWVARRWPKGIIRTKGICYFDDEQDKCYIFEQAGKQVTLRDAGRWFATMPPEELREALERDAQLQRDWDDFYGDRMQKLVFIGQHLDKELIERTLDECLV